jgi:NADPH-dependent glutamate synthase beta subunit-like oxidoreductase
MTSCPAHVDIPGYIALVKAGRYADAVRLIREDNPFPSVCGLICEHPCEDHCRRNIVDTSINIRGLKRAAIENAGHVDAPKCLPKTGKSVAVIGGGPTGLTCAYYLALMGHSVTVFERQKKFGGMLRYGIPRYRLPSSYLDEDINVILSTGIDARTGVDVGKDITFEEIMESYDGVYIAIGAHSYKMPGIPGENSEGVISAVELLRAMGDDEPMDLKGKNVCVIGGGNVAMDACRTAIRLGAASVKCIYRRRQSDMTALPAEINGAMAEGVELVTLVSPVRVNADENGRVVSLVVQPQIPGDYKNGRPTPRNSSADEIEIPCDIVIAAIGQAIDFGNFIECGIPEKLGKFQTESTGAVAGKNGIYAGGDCASGPATVIKAIQAGKTAAANLDEYFGFHSQIANEIDIPAAGFRFKDACGRCNMTDRSPADRIKDFELIENSMTLEEAAQECARCLRCDHYGCGAFRGGRNKW